MGYANRLGFSVKPLLPPGLATCGDFPLSLPGEFSDISKTQYDPATVNWGKEWRIPRKLELVELFDKSTFVRTTYNSIEGLRVIGPNGNSIFLPASGYKMSMAVIIKESSGIIGLPYIVIHIHGHHINQCTFLDGIGAH